MDVMKNRVPSKLLKQPGFLCFKHSGAESIINDCLLLTLRLISVLEPFKIRGAQFACIIMCSSSSPCYCDVCVCLCARACERLGNEQLDSCKPGKKEKKAQELFWA